MKQLLFFCLTFLLFIPITFAKECPMITEQTIKPFYAGDYGGEYYCANGRNLRQQGCFPLTIASILRSSGANVDVLQVRDYLCENFFEDANSVTYGRITASEEFQNKFAMKINPIIPVSASVDLALMKNHMVLASVHGGIYPSDPISGLHYVAIAMKSGLKYYVINTGKREQTGWYTLAEINENILNRINAGIWEVYPTDCDENIINNGGNSNNQTPPVTPGDDSAPPKPNNGLTDDPFTGFPSIKDEEFTCETVFLKSNGEDKQVKILLDGIFSLLQIIVPVVAIGLSIMDYIKALINQDQSVVKKTNSKTIKRLIVAIIFIFLPYLMDLLFKLFGLYDISRCGIGS